MEHTQATNRIGAVSSIYSAFEGAAERYRDHTAFKSAGSDRREFSYAEVKAISAQIAAGLVNQKGNLPVS